MSIRKNSIWFLNCFVFPSSKMKTNKASKIPVSYLKRFGTILCISWRFLSIQGKLQMCTILKDLFNWHAFSFSSLILAKKKEKFFRKALFEFGSSVKIEKIFIYLCRRAILMISLSWNIERAHHWWIKWAPGNAVVDRTWCIRFHEK